MIVRVTADQSSDKASTTANPFLVSFPQLKILAGSFAFFTLLFAIPLLAVDFPRAVTTVPLLISNAVLASLAVLGSFRVWRVEQGYIKTQNALLRFLPSTILEFEEIESVSRHGKSLYFLKKAGLFWSFRAKSRHASEICQALRDAGFTKIVER